MVNIDILKGIQPNKNGICAKIFDTSRESKFKLIKQLPYAPGVDPLSKLV